MTPKDIKPFGPQPTPDDYRIHKGPVSEFFEKGAEIVEAVSLRERDQEAIRALREALREVEWMFVQGQDESHCPCCGCWRSDGHSQSCALRTALDKAQEV